MGCFAFAAFFPFVVLSLEDRKNSFLIFFFSRFRHDTRQRNPRGEVRFELFPPGKEKTWGQ